MFIRHALLGLTFLAIGCGGDDDLVTPAGDASTEAGSGIDAGTGMKDATAPLDAPSTKDVAAPTEAGIDAPAPIDAGVDASLDAGLDASVETGADSGCNSGPNDDNDGDGFTVAQGDCNDCDANVNPGAIDVLHSPGDGGAPFWGNEDCTGVPGPPNECDQGLALDDVDPNHAARAIDLCKTTTASERTWGVLTPAYTRADGTPYASPGLQVGLEPAFGANVNVQNGSTMLLVSSGHARTTTQPGACGTASCVTNVVGTAPSGFPQDNPSCPPSRNIDDDVAFSVSLRAPTNAVGYSFDFKFNSFEFPEYVCTSYNDQFIAIVSPAPTGSISGNVAFDPMHTPVSVNFAYFGVCDPSTVGLFAQQCTMDGSGTCPSAPSPYCPFGASQLSGTGFDVWGGASAAGATSWLRTQAPVQGGSTFTIRFAIWDSGDTSFDSSVLVDNFQWITAPGSVGVGTSPIASPK